MSTELHPADSSDTPVPNLEAVLDGMRQGETDGVAEMRGLLERFPDSLDILGNLAWALAHRGEHEEGIALYRQCLELDPGDAELHWRIADRLVNLGRLEEALEAYRTVGEQFPDCEDARMGVRYVQHLLRSQNREKKAYVPAKGEQTELQRKNAEINNKEYKANRIRLESLPPRLYLESTTKCNFYCRTCSKGYGPYYAEDLQADIFEMIRREVMPANIRISITGFGEPTLAGNFDEIFQMALDNGSQVHFVTNGSLLNFERIEKLTRHPVAITLSVDGATKETFESIRTGSNFERFLEKLAMIKKLRDIHLSAFFSHFSFNFVALRGNLHELADVIRLAARHGIDCVGVADYAFNDMEFDENSPRFDPEHSNRCLAEARRVAGDLCVTVDLPPEYLPAPPPEPKSGLWTKIRKAGRFLPEPRRFPRRCSSPWTEPYVHTNGHVTPCCASGQYLGDLKSRSFQQVWNGWRYRLLRWRIHTTFPPLGCRRCFLCWGINGGNAGNVMAKEGILIKALYALEVAGRRLARRTINASKQMAARKRKTEQAPDSGPNFYLGRPISDFNRPADE